ncbi:MAG: hypothetical protein M1833_005900 [Piccolia ochrophora]|nr:MAG: hypothetical protein M1833_005900 [Piccolia ochrophora]
MPYTRFEIELEFVQCLANPSYLSYIATNQLLQDDRFIQYIRYLKYWMLPEYAVYLTFPEATFRALTDLQQPRFRADIIRPDVVAQYASSGILGSMTR